MVMRPIFVRATVLWFFCFCAAWGADRFDQVKAKLAEAACTRFEFRSIVESNVFDQVDSLDGTAYLAHDGRFNITLGPDRYLFDGNNLYSYSAENNQVVIEQVDDTEMVSREISFITKLDKFYNTQSIKPDSLYRLLKKDGVKGDIPDSITVSVSRRALRLERLEYYDVNDERTVIVILSQQPDTVCSNREFQPDFPDSVERLKL
jgi:outer membrane lipoprotein-sorting protein